MKAVLRQPWIAVALCLALAFPAGAIERDAPVGPPSGLNLAAPKALPPAPILSVNAAVPLTPGAQTATELPQESLQTPTIFPAAEINPVAPSVDGPKAQVEAENLPPTVTPGTNQVLAQLSPENAGRVGDEQSSALAAKLIDPSIKASASDTAAPVYGETSASGELAPWQRENLASGVIVPEQKPAKDPRPTIPERLHYGDLWVRNIWFYVYTNIRNKWGPYLGYWQKLRDSGVPPIVSHPREFFATMRIFGQTGYFYVPGFGPVEDAEVVREARATFRKFFDGPGITEKEIAAFDGFVDRAMLFNNKRRAASKFRANVRDQMLKASTMTPDKIAPFFDGLPVMAKTDEFQNKGIADAILAEFKQTVLDVIKEEPQGAPDRITGVILIGSFALGAATPKSDFDIEPLTADGGSGRVRAFAKKVEQRWIAAGRQGTNPVSFHYFGYLNSRWELRKIHHEPYIIISPDQAITANLAMRPGEAPSHIPSRKMTPTGRFLRGLQYAAVYATSLITPAKYPDKL